jgi:hypothetical protein
MDRAYHAIFLVARQRVVYINLEIRQRMTLFLAEFSSTHRTAGNLRILQPTPRSLGSSQVVL